ncbi:MAG: hypothetical protein WCG78_07245, partial [Candidatus Omnitrophota bacterium]
TTLTTYISNIPFGVGSGGAAPVFAQANALIVQGGVRSGKTLSNVVLLNADTSKPIAVRQLTILFTGGGRLTKIVGNSVTLYSGNALSGSTVTLVTPFVPGGSAWSSMMSLTFQNPLNAVTKLVWIMSDGSSSAEYAW